MNLKSVPISKRKLSLLLLLCFLFLCISFLIYQTIFRSPKATVFNAVRHTLTNVDTTAADYLHLKELRTIHANGLYQTTCNLTIEDYTIAQMQDENYRQLLTLAPGISVKTQMNYPDKLADHSIDLLLGGSSILNAHAYQMDDTIGIECPSYYDGCLSFNTMTLAEDYNQSYLSSLLKNSKVNKGLNFDLFSAHYSEKGLLEQYSEYYAKENKALYEAMTVKKVKGETIQIGTKSILANGYEISIPREHMKKAIDNLFYLAFQQSEFACQKLRDQLDASLGTLTLPEVFIGTVYIDPQSNTMLKFVHQSEYQIDEISNTVTGSIEWLGEEYPTNDIRAKITLKDPNGIQKSASCNITSKTQSNRYQKTYMVAMTNNDDITTSKKINATVKYSIDTQNGAFTFHSDVNNKESNFMNLELTGAFTNIAAGKSIFLDIDQATLDIPDFSVSLTGDYTFETLQTEVPAPPTTLRPVLKMSEDDFYGFVYEMIRNFSSTPLGSYLYN